MGHWMEPINTATLHWIPQWRRTACGYEGDFWERETGHKLRVCRRCMRIVFAAYCVGIGNIAAEADKQKADAALKEFSI